MLKRVGAWRLVGLVVRTQIHKKKLEGKKRATKYEGKYVYVRVKLPSGKRKDIYLGTEHMAAATLKTARSRSGENATRPPASSRQSEGWRKGVEKGARADGDTRELIDGRPDPRQMPLFESEFARKQYRAFERMGKRRK